MPYPRIEGKTIALDTETTGLKWWEDVIFGVAIATDEGEWYWDVRREPKIWAWLSRNLNTTAKIVGHNIKFDCLFMKKAGCEPWGEKLYDTMIQGALINEHEFSYDLDSLGHKYVGAGKDVAVYAELAELFGGPPTKHAQAPNLHKAPHGLVGRYAKQDVRTTLALFKWQMDEIERQDLFRVVDLERRLLPIVINMEWEGVRVDVGRAEQAVEVVSAEIITKQKRLDELAGFPVNPNPSGSIHRLFAPRQDASGQWRCSDGTPIGSTPAGKPSLNADALRRIKLPAAELVLDIRQLIRMKDVFLLGHVLSYQVDGLIHCNMNQTKGDSEHGTGTGRFSIDTPALQQIPKRNKLIAKVVRSVFIPDKDHHWLCADYSQFEFRWFAHFAKNLQLIDAYNKDPDIDFHGLTAKLTGLPRVKTPEIKGNAKQINLGLVFGMGEGRMASEMGLPYTVEFDEQRGKEWLKAGPEAKALFSKYHQAIPGIKGYLERASAVARDRGFVVSVGGRHIRFPGGFFTHKAGGIILQASAADALKQKMIETYNGLAAMPIRLMLSVHDELNFSSYIGYTHDVEAVKEIMEDFGPKSAYPMRVPVRTDPKTGDNWWEASKE